MDSLSLHSKKRTEDSPHCAGILGATCLPGDASPAAGPRVSQRCCDWDAPALCAPGSSARCLTRDLSFLSWGHFHITWDTTRRCLWKTLPEQLNAYVPQIRHWEEKTRWPQPVRKAYGNTSTSCSGRGGTRHVCVYGTLGEAVLQSCV